MDIRWMQWVQSYEKAVVHLTEFISQEKLNKIEVQGHI